MLDFIVAATHGPIGPHPIFIVSPDPSALSPTLLNPRMDRVATELEALLPEAAQRVFSVFGPTVLTQAFVRAWCNRAAVLPVEAPYLSATLMHCTRTTLALASPLESGQRIRLARAADADAVALMCQSFSAAPYVLTLENARQEAISHIADKAMWLYEVASSDEGRPRIVSMVAVGRKTLNVGCITKMFTLPSSERQGYATRLLRYVCSHLMNGAGMTSVVAFIPHGNAAAATIARRIGFIEASRSYRDWLEIGFQDTDLGHW